ncbi:MAG TPA: ABC transporter permease [Candidatus Limnocylindrales bacterium]|nr:ABC transporter permease [Candidatus Limnocylindrales bacterium]
MATGTRLPSGVRNGRGRDVLGTVLRTALPLVAVAAALLVGAVMLAVLGADPVRAYGALFEGAFGSTSGITQTLVKATPLLLVGLGICIAFRASVINIGAEGQIILGAVFATWFALAFRTWPGWLLIPSTIVIGFVAGAFWGFVPGILKARMGVNEILTTVMMNAIALQFMNYMIRGPLIDPAGVTAGQYLAQSEKLPEQVWLARLIPQTLLHAGIFVALALAIVTYVFLWRTTIGYRIRAVGLNPDASRYAGIRVPRYQALSLTLAGGLAGVAGAIEVIGVQHRLLDGVTSGYGFSGIVTALFGGLHPLGTIPASFIFGGLLVGADKMQREVQVPSSLIQAILGLIVLFVVASQYWARRRSNRTNDAPTTPAAAALGAGDGQA